MRRRKERRGGIYITRRGHKERKEKERNENDEKKKGEL